MSLHTCWANDKTNQSTHWSAMQIYLHPNKLHIFHARMLCLFSLMMYWKRLQHHSKKEKEYIQVWCVMCSSCVAMPMVMLERVEDFNTLDHVFLQMRPTRCGPLNAIFVSKPGQEKNSSYSPSISFSHLWQVKRYTLDIAWVTYICCYHVQKGRYLKSNFWITLNAKWNSR
jgi:hypothetical protein